MIRIGVIGDIHSHEKKENELQGGYYFPSMSETPVHLNPFAALKELIRKREISFDYLLSPGDYAHQIDLKGLVGSWNQLKIISKEVDAKLLLGTVGNHDVASRSEHNPFQAIRDFDSDFPVYLFKKSNTFKNDLLDKSYYLIEDEDLDVLFVVLNSCFDHWTQVEASRGKINMASLASIKTDIANSKRLKKILLVHHHPIIHETGIHDTSDVMEGSEDLMKSIGDIDLIIHGHKHDFRFTQKIIYPKNLNILSAGSFACFQTSLKTLGLNTFHEIEFHEEIRDNCLNHGIIRTYVYYPSQGWELSDEMQEGFGCVLNQKEIESTIKDIVKGWELPYISWEEILQKAPSLDYISRETRLNVLTNLENIGIVKRTNYKQYNSVGDIIIR